MPESPPPDLWLSFTSGGAKLFFAFLLGWFAALATRIWQNRIDEHSQRHDELRSAILQAAEVSTNYWLKIDDLGDRQAEARLVGLFRLLTGLAVGLARATRDDPWTHAQRLVLFCDLTTGGPDYEVDERLIDTSRAMAVQLEAADLILYFQEYRRRRLTLCRSIRIGFFRR